MTEDDILDGILEREGEGTPPYLSPGDAGGRTRFGISERAHPELWSPGPPTRAQARACYAAEYVAPFDLLETFGVDDRIRVAAIDEGVLSGVERSVKGLQAIAGVATDGVLGPVTAQALRALDPARTLTALVVARTLRTVALVQKRPSDLVFLGGWVRRILGFLPVF